VYYFSDVLQRRLCTSLALCAVAARAWVLEAASFALHYNMKLRNKISIIILHSSNNNNMALKFKHTKKNLPHAQRSEMTVLVGISFDTLTQRINARHVFFPRYIFPQKDIILVVSRTVVRKIVMYKGEDTSANWTCTFSLAISSGPFFQTLKTKLIYNNVRNIYLASEYNVIIMQINIRIHVSGIAVSFNSSIQMLQVSFASSELSEISSAISSTSTTVIQRCFM
jgi:hypothetical protein